MASRRSDGAAPFLDGRMQGEDRMPPTMRARRPADIADHADEASAGDEGVEAAPPHLVELIEEGVVVGDVAHLAGMVAVAFQGPVGR